MRIRILAAVVAVVAVASSLAATDVTGPTEAGTQAHRHHDQKAHFQLSRKSPKERLSNIACTDGYADVFACDGVDLVGFVPFDEFAGDGSQGAPAGLGTNELSEVWGWTDPETGIEYVLVGKLDGTAIFSLEDPANPTYLGDIVNPTPAHFLWFDVKVIENTAVITSESVGFGMQTFDLTQLRGVTEPQTWTPTGIYLPNVASHNVAVNTDTGFAYLVGSNGVGPVVAGISGTVGGIEPCNGGLHAVDLSDPSMPVFAGCFAMDGYTHDAQCVTYHGPDADYTDHEICVAYNEDEVVIVDMTDKLNAYEISRFTYEQASYTHQGWFTEDQRYILFNDEGDEQDYGIPTRTLVADLSDLDNPEMVGWYSHPVESIDHNNYVRDGLAYQSNYTSGLRVVDLDGIATADLEEVAYFDTYPDHDRNIFAGTWSNYPFLPSGYVVVSSGTEGLFVLKVHDDVLAEYADPFEPAA